MTEMHDPAHPGEIIREAIDTEGWTVQKTADGLGVARGTLQRILNGHAGVSLRTAIALQNMGWSNAAFWVRLQGQYDLAKARREIEAAA